ncbi:solute carrier family 23 member 1-like [Gigantopelta aegis]|uniref:solute carrier family 23 member 1-like n=1 Tax=Gigantopelta aegis TaxID=1735272 RepID=UPI001B8873BC|nr:solute carrier family 23 member 1-like [Gigantopelta aegis]
MEVEIVMQDNLPSVHPSASDKQQTAPDNKQQKDTGDSKQTVPNDGQLAASNGGQHTTVTRIEMLYTVTETPPWYLCILLAFQHYLTAFGSTITVPLVLAKHLCVAGDVVGLSEILGTIFFVSGISTLLQTTFGVRLPIVQGATFAFLAPAISVLNLPIWQCPFNETSQTDVSFNSTQFGEIGGDAHREIWQSRIREIQGAVMVASLFQVLIGFSGLMGMVLHFIGPLSIAPTIALIGLSLFDAASEKASKHWWIAITTVILITVFSQYLRNITVPCPRYTKKDGCAASRKPVFKLFPILLAMGVAWVICALLTVFGALPSDPDDWGYYARTDVRSRVLTEAPWFRFPYPGQWGMPTVSASAVFGMLAGVMASMIESVGDYYACASLTGSPPPPVHAVNRGIGIEGITCIIAGAWGTANGTTSYSENVGAIGITKVGSRAVVQTAGVLLVLMGCMGKVGALFVTMPDPVVGGMFIVMFGMITAVGLSNLQHVQLTSSRNLFILGLSLFLGLSLPKWMQNNKQVIKTGNASFDQIVEVLLSTSMFVGGFLGFLLDNTLPGTAAERGIQKWRERSTHPDDYSSASDMHIYDLPLVQKYLDQCKWTRYLPFLPTSEGNNQRKCQCSIASLCKCFVKKQKNTNVP